MKLIHIGKGFAITAKALVFALLLIPYPSFSQTDESIEGLGAVSSEIASTGTLRVIVRISPAAAPGGRPLVGEVLQAAQADLGRFLDSAGAKETSAIPGQPLLVLEVQQDQLDALSESGRIDAIQKDAIERAYLAESVPLVRAPEAWNIGGRGAGQDIAIVDSGVEAGHAFFGGRVVSEACFSTTSPSQGSTSLCPNGLSSQLGPGAAAPCSISGCDHGTHVAGIAAGSGPNFSGTAPDASIIAIQAFSRFVDQVGGPRNCAAAGTSSPCILTFRSDQIRALQRVLDLSGSRNIASVNMSLGGGRELNPCNRDLRKGVIDQLRSSGIATVIASGNDGFADAVGAPGCIPTAVTVGSTTKADAISGFSNSADMVDLLAPGSSINSSVSGNSFGRKSGTSMATPHVAGAFAAIRSANPGATVDAIEAELVSTGLSITDIRNGISKPRIDIGEAADLDRGQRPSVSLSLEDPNRRLKKSETMVARATVMQNGAPLNGERVDFSTGDTNLLTVSPASATTDPLGVAQATLRGEASSSGTTTVEAVLANGGSRDQKPVLVPDLSLLGFLLMLTGVAGCVIWVCRYEKSG